MKVIKHLVEDIQDEVEGAEHYAKAATKYRDSDRELADLYYKLAGIELEHVNALHAQVVRLIKDYKATGAETPAAMQAVWDWEHKKIVDVVTKVKTLLDVYKGM